MDRLDSNQLKIINFVKNYFKKDNSPFLKKNYFAFYEDGYGYKKIKYFIFKEKHKQSLKNLIVNLYNFINIFKLNITFISKKKIFYKNLIITWGDETSFKNGVFYDKYFSLNSDTYKNTFWIILSNNKFKLKNIKKNIAVFYPKNKIKNFFYFLLFIVKYFFKKKDFFLDQDSNIANNINNYIFNNLSLSRIENLIMPYEGQAFQKQIFFEQKKNNNKLKTYGFDHSAPHSLPTQLYFTKGSPDKLLVGGINTKKCYSNFYNWPKKKIIVTFPRRYMKFKKSDFVNNLFLPYDFDNESVLIDSLHKYLTTLPSNFLNKINIKIHPVKLLDKRHILLKKKIENLFTKFDNKFSNRSENLLTIVVGFTTTAIVALEFKMPVLHICANPNFDKYSSFFWSDISIKRINNNCFLYKLKSNYKYLDFNKKDQIKQILK